MSQTSYTIKDVASRTGMSPSTLRFYDKKGLLTFVQRNASGVRIFTDEDFELLYVIHCLKNSGMPLSKIKVFMELYLQGNATIHERKELFEEHRETILKQIEELKEMLAIVEYKCWFFEQAEQCKDVNYYKKLPREEIPAPITAFYKKVDDFRSKKSS